MDKLGKLVKGFMDKLDLPEIPTLPTPPAAAASLPPRVIIPPRRTSAEAAAMAERLESVRRLVPPPVVSTVHRTLGSRLQGWLSGLPGSLLAGTLAASPAAAAPARPAPVIQMPITVTIQAPAGADEQRIATLARRAVEEATSQAGRRIAALYDGSDL